ncbi:MAG: flagellar hook-basal body complex protein [Oscillospiraceae bacterium]|nr:flagellar hook-basal body complex protein [Oscillospiraceae bacterium]
MVRSLYSGVTGMKAHQTRLDVIGNNLANVNTIGFKSSSVTFRDVYYQSLRGAAAGDGTKGGVNSSMVGYGAEVGSIDLNMSQSATSTTGNAWDVSIGGEGFFQVQDSNGNIYYTRAGKLGYDNNGYLVDSNGYFVLGTAAVNGSVVGQKPGDSRIQMAVPSVNPTRASAENTINNVKFTVTAGKETEDGNVTFNFLSKTLPAGVAAEAAVTSTGVTIWLNSDQTFKSLDELNSAINEAIQVANGGKEHPGGIFTLSAEPNLDWGDKGFTGAELCQTSASPKLGTVSNLNVFSEWGFGFPSDAIGEGFTPGGEITNFVITDSYAADNATHLYTVTLTIAGEDGQDYIYEGKISESQMTAGGRELQLKSTTSAIIGDTITITCPSQKTIEDKAAKNKEDNVTTGWQDDGNGVYSLTLESGTDFAIPPQTGDAVPVTISASEASRNVGLSSNAFTLKEGTVGGEQTLADISGFKIGANGIIYATHRGVQLELGRIDLATFENPSGLEQVGGTYFTATGNSGEASITEAGLNGTGALASSTLELSNVDMSQEFADMITTQRGFQANSRMITVSDTLLEELINLKR